MYQDPTVKQTNCSRLKTEIRNKKFKPIGRKEVNSRIITKLTASQICKKKELESSKNVKTAQSIKKVGTKPTARKQ